MRLQSQCRVLSPPSDSTVDMIWLASTAARRNKRAGEVPCEIAREVHFAQPLMFCHRQIQNKQLYRLCFCKISKV